MICTGINNTNVSMSRNAFAHYNCFKCSKLLAMGCLFLFLTCLVLPLTIEVWKDSILSTDDTKAKIKQLLQSVAINHPGLGPFILHLV
jgi:hypothetical protein